MPGGRFRPFRLGDRTELLAEFILNNIAFTTRIPRQEDVGHDLICALSELRGKLYWAGPTFTVQVKSDREPLVLEKAHQLAWIQGLENPFFIAVGDRTQLRLDLYSTWARLNGIQQKAARRIILKLGPSDAEFEGIQTAEDGSEQTIPLGKPIVSVNAEQMMKEGFAQRIQKTLRWWVELDRQNIVHNSAGMYWVRGPTKYTTNGSPPN